MPRRFGTAKTNRNVTTDEWRNTVRAVMGRLGYSYSDLARLSRVAESTLRSESSRGFFNRRLQAGIEDALGVAVFSTRAEFNQRQRQTKLLGLSPVFASRDEIRAIARRVGLVGYSHLVNKRKLVEKLCERLEVQNLSASRTHTKSSTAHEH